jgi:hypothetical protein
MYLGLVMQHELFVLERPAQPIFNTETAHDGVRHLRCVKEVTVAAHLGFLQGRLTGDNYICRSTTIKTAG